MNEQSRERWAAEGKVIDQLIDRSGYTRAEFAHLMDVSTDVVSNMCRGITRLSGNRRLKAASILGIKDETLRDLLKPGGPLPRATIAKPSYGESSSTVNIRGKVIVVPTGMSPVPIYGSVPAGVVGRSFSDAQDVEFMPEWNDDVVRWGRYVVGASMEEEFLDGDIVIFEQCEPLPNQAVYAVKDGDDCFKILKPKHGGYEFAPLNRAFEPFSAEGWVVMGRIVQRIRYTLSGVKDIREYPSSFRFRVQ